ARLPEGADDAIFSGGAGINGERHTGTAVDKVGESVARAQTAKPSRLVVDTAIERGVDAQKPAEFDAGVGARNVEKAGTIQGADPHVINRFGLDGKVSPNCSCYGQKTGRSARENVLKCVHRGPTNERTWGLFQH